MEKQRDIVCKEIEISKNAFTVLLLGTEDRGSLCLPSFDCSHFSLAHIAGLNVVVVFRYVATKT